MHPDTPPTCTPTRTNIPGHTIMLPTIANLEDFFVMQIEYVSFTLSYDTFCVLHTLHPHFIHRSHILPSPKSIHIPYNLKLKKSALTNSYHSVDNTHSQLSHLHAYLKHPQLFNLSHAQNTFEHLTVHLTG